MAYRNKTYVAFDGDTDMWAYGYMRGWKQSDNTNFDFDDAHELKQARDSSTEETIKRSLRYRMNNSKVFVLLVGTHTKNLYRFVRWEIEQAISLGLPIIVVNLNGKRTYDSVLCPPILDNELAVHISYNAKILQYALENWPADYVTRLRNGERQPCHYYDRIYDGLGL